MDQCTSVHPALHHPVLMSGDNKLRPYYDHDTFNAGYLVIFKRGVGLIDTTSQREITSGFGINATKPSFGIGLGIPAVPAPPRMADKNYVYDLEFAEYFDSQNMVEVLKNLAWNFVKNYCKVVLSQPLDIVRLILQVGHFDFLGARPHAAVLLQKRAPEFMAVSDSMYDDEEIEFFQPWKPTEHPLHLPEAEPEPVPEPAPKNAHKLYPISQHTIDIMSAVASKDGPFALFRGINASFIHYTLLHTIEAWITGFVSPLLNIPDPFFLDLTHSSDPVRSLWLSVIACVLTGVILMPLDLIKVKFMITPFNKTASADQDSSPGSTPVPEDGPAASTFNPRSIRDSFRHYPLQYLVRPSPSVAVLTVIYQFSTIVFRKLAPYLLFVRYNIDLYLSPSLFTMANLLLLIGEFFFKLPVENLLRKEQVRFLLAPKSLEEDPYRVVTIDNPEENLLVDYNGWNTDFEGRPLDGEQRSVWARVKDLGLFKGWRVGVLNVIGYWGYNIFKRTSVMAEEPL